MPLLNLALAISVLEMNDMQKNYFCGARTVRTVGLADLLLGQTRIVVAYVPVVHSALLSLLEEVQAPILVLGQEFLAEFPQLNHDLRAVIPDQAQQMLTGLRYRAEVMEKNDLRALSASVDYVLPEDEVMTQFAERYLNGFRVEFRPCFLRWHKRNLTSEEAVSPDQVVTSEQFAVKTMKLAYQSAMKSADWWRQVGAVVVRDSQVLVVGFNKYLPTDFSPVIDGDIRVCFGFGERFEICGPIHAEAAVISHCAAEGLKTEGADLFSTTFPCPQCARIITEAGFRRVFYVEGYSVADAHHILASRQVEVVKVQF